MNIARDSEVVELNNPPTFNYGQKVRSRKSIRNDGTFPGREIGEILVKKGDEGFVVSIGTFLQQFYIYGVDFPAHGYRVGMKRKELEAAEEQKESDRAGEPMIDPVAPKYQWGQRVKAALDLYNDGSYPDLAEQALIAPAGTMGEIVQIGTHTELNLAVYMVEFETNHVVGCLENEIGPVS